MEIGTSIFLSAVVGAISFVTSDIFNNFVSGLWIRHAGEVVPGDKITVKTDFEKKTGTVKDIHMRNLIVELESGKELLVESKKVFQEDVIRERGGEK